MGKLIDMTGWKMWEHGVPDSKWTVIKRDELHYSKNKAAYWVCQCSCSNHTIKTIEGSALRRGTTKSCGCNTYFIDMTNWNMKEHGILDSYITVMNKDNISNGNITWKCKCDCGSIFVARGDQIRNGSIKSCGCKALSLGEKKIKETLQNNNIKYETQKTFSSCCFPKTKRIAKFDFYLPEYNCIIEYDGAQHYKAGWNNDEQELYNIQERDRYKNIWCFNNKISLIRIPYTHYKDISLLDLLPESSSFLIREDVYE